MSIFSLYKTQHFIEIASRLEIDMKLAISDLDELLKDNLTENNIIRRLQSRWYNSLEKTPDYSVYDDPYYLLDLWSCWVLYSRKGLLALNNKTSMPNNSVINYIGKIENVLDLGCGFAYTTAALKELFPESNLFGTNIENTYQYKLAEGFSKVYNFKIIPDYKIDKKIDLIFASEYFEHIERPIEHLTDLINYHNPKFLIIANSFNTYSIGHFIEYDYINKKIIGSEISKLFNNKLRLLGYEKIKTNIWNNKPALWERSY